MSDQVRAKQRLILTDKCDLEVDGVDGILAFDDGYVAVALRDGALVVEGEGLKVDNLSKAEGKIHIIGAVSALSFSDGSKRTGRAKLFK